MRGDIRTIAAGGNMSKPRPVVVVQSDAIETARTLVVCPFHSIEERVEGCIAPSAANGLMKWSIPMATQVAAVKKARLGDRIGSLDEMEMALVEDAMREVLGL